MPGRNVKGRREAYLVADTTTKKLEQLLRKQREMEKELIYLRAMVRRRIRDVAPPPQEQIASFVIPPQELDNYILPGGGSRTCHGWKVQYDKGGKNGFYNNDTTEHEISDPLGMSCVMPGDTVMCRKNQHAIWNDDFTTEVGWEPLAGQGLIRPGKTYKEINAGDFIDGTNVWFTNPIGDQNYLQLSDISPGLTWCHSGVSIEASESEPKQILLAFIKQGPTGSEWMIIARQCNITPTG